MEPASGRGPCPYCREYVDVRASVCPHCRRNVLLDLIVTQPVTDARLRYHLSRQLFEHKVGPTLSELLERLERGGPLLRGVTLAPATATLELLTAAAVHAVTGPSDEKPIGFTSKIPWKLVGLAGAFVVVVLGLAVFWFQRGSIGFGARSPREIASRALDSVVLLRCKNSLGTGFFVEETRLITNEHVTCDSGAPLEVEMRDGRKGTARVLKSSKRLDAAVLEVADLRGKPLAIESAGGLAAGDPVMVIGNPVGLESTVHVGTVSNPRRIMLDVSYLQLDARINPGNSGGPALDDEGRVVGIVSMKRADAEGIGMALPIDYLYEGSSPLLEPPRSYPTPGFSKMLEGVEKELKKLEQERELVGFRLVKALRRSRVSVVAIVVTMADSLPNARLDFRLESGNGSCKTSAEPEWKVSDPTDPFAARARDFMRDRGFGQVYVGMAQLDFSKCAQPPGDPAALVLCDGDEKENRLDL